MVNLDQYRRTSSPRALSMMRFLRVNPLRKRRRIPPQRQPDLIRMEYYKALLPYATLAGRAFRSVRAEFMRVYESVLAASSEEKKDESPEEKMLRLIRESKELAAKALSEDDLFRVAEKFGNRTSNHARNELGKQVNAALGVSLSDIERPITSQLNAFAVENVSLIKTVHERYFARLERDTLRALESGQSGRDFAAQLERDYDISEHEAERIARDQVGKLSAELNEARVEALGITEYIWRTTGDNRVRDEHAELDGQRFSYDDPPNAGTDGEPANPGEAIQCVPGFTPISIHGATEKTYRRWYSGELTTLVTDSGESVSMTPNHPVLTRDGWKAAHLVNAGDYLVHASSEFINSPVHNPKRGNANAEEVFSSLSSTRTLHRIAELAGWFHGDAVGGQYVDVVYVNGGLFCKLYAKLIQLVRDESLSFAAKSRLAISHLSFCIVGFLRTAYGVMSGLSQSHALCSAGLGHANKHRFASSSYMNSERDEHASYRRPLAAKHPSDSDLAHAVRVQPNDFVFRKVESVASRPFSGHVYNFETTCGWYAASNLLIHNCRCYAEPAFDQILGG